jgi:hypothetical protein
MTEEKIEEIDLTEESLVPTEAVKEKIKFPPLPTSKEIIQEKVEKEIPKEVKKKEVERFNENPNTKKFGVIAIGKKTYLALWIFAILFFLLLAVGTILKYSSFDKLLDKDFSPDITNNINPNVTAQFTEGADNVYIYNNYSTTNNITLNATFVLPNNLTIKVVNLTA